tara:strand:+ start:813 stop:2270 length:1458 start_codon:yes stop_codon:yes gene_type:complete
MIDEYFEEEEIVFDVKGDEINSQLPSLVRRYVEDAVEVSKYNDIPATLTFFNLLGQIMKDKVTIVRGKGREDTRVPVLWLQTSGTGKTEMFNFYGKVSDLVFELLNSKYENEPTINEVTAFDIFDITDFTDAALIGSNKEVKIREEDEDGNVNTVYDTVTQIGALEGHGLMVFDEFEYSGVFKQSQHKENVIVYLNKLMNTLHGNNHLVKKKLKDGSVIICDCRRSPYATSYIPKGLTSVIAEKGVLQRMLIFIWEVPQEIQDEIRESVLMEVGTEIDNTMPVNKYANAIVKIYETVEERYQEVDQNPKRVIRYGQGFNEALVREYQNMRDYVSHSRPEVFEIAGNFITRLNNHMVRIAILCCIAESPGIPDKNNRFIVTPRNVAQASILIRQCYKSLVSWLDDALKVEKQQAQENANIGAFKDAYNELKDKDGWVNKSLLIARVREITNKSQSTIYNWLDTIGDSFEEETISRKKYVRLKEVEI